MDELINVNSDPWVSLKLKEDLPHWILLRAFPLSKIFQPDEKILIQIVCLFSIKQNCKLEIFQEEDFLLSLDVSLSPHGLGLEELEPLPIGNYSVRARMNQFVSDFTFFQIANSSFSFLTADLNVQKKEDQIVYEFDLKRFDGTRFEGNVNCQINQFSFQKEVQEGKLKISKVFSELENTRFIFTDDQGNRFEKMIPAESINQFMDLNDFGTKYTASIMPSTNSLGEFYGIFISKTNINTDDFMEIDKILVNKGEMGKIKFTKDANKNSNYKIYTLNLFENKTILKSDIPSPLPELVEFPVSPPFTKILITFLNPIGELREREAIVFVKDSIDLKVQTIQNLEANSPLSIQIQSSRPSDFLIILKPKSIPSYKPHEEFAVSILNSIRLTYNFITNNKPIESKTFSKKLKKFENRFMEIMGILGMGLVILIFFPIIVLYQILIFPFKISGRKTVQNSIRNEISRFEEYSQNYLSNKKSFETELEITQSREKEFSESEFKEYNATIISAELWENQTNIKTTIEGISDIGELELYVFAVSQNISAHKSIKIISSKKPRTLDSSSEEKLVHSGFETLKSKISILREGEKLEGGRYLVFPSPKKLMEFTALSILEYPYRSTEQYFARLFTCGFLYQEILKKSIQESQFLNLKYLEKEIQITFAKIRRLIHTEFSDYLIGHFDSSSASLPLTIQSLIHLKPFFHSSLSDKFPEIENLGLEMKNKISRENQKDNRLLFLGKEFKEIRYTSPESAAAEILYLGANKNALDYLEVTRKTTPESFYWQGKSIAGNIQTTALVARAYKKLNRPEFYVTWEYLKNQFIENRMYSSSDSTEILILFSELSERPDSKAIINGKEIHFVSLEEPGWANSVHCIEGEILIKEEFSEEVDSRNIISNIPFTTSPIPKQFSLYHTLKITVEANKNQCLIARLTSSGNLIFPLSGSKSFQMEKHFVNGKVEFELKAIELGTSEIKIEIIDLYNPELRASTNVFSVEIIS